MAGVAMFNSNSQFLQWISKRKAITLICIDQAYGVNPTEEKWRSPSLEVFVPRGVVLKGRAEKFIHMENSYTAEKCKARDNHICQYCGTKIGPMTIDHITPQSKGGKDGWLNCVASCRKCNERKDRKTLQEAGMKLLRQPFKPKIPDDADVWEMIFDDNYLPKD